MFDWSMGLDNQPIDRGTDEKLSRDPRHLASKYVNHSKENMSGFRDKAFLLLQGQTRAWWKRGTVEREGRVIVFDDRQYRVDV
jgi:hypothetical protein